MFIDGNYRNIKHFCKATSLSISKFKNYVLLISQTNKELFEKYCLTVKMHENKRNLSNDEIVNLLIKYIKNGMLKNGVLNEFNLNDYYNTINIQFEFLIEIIDSNKTLNQNDLELIKEFLNKCNIKMKSL